MLYEVITIPIILSCGREKTKISAGSGRLVWWPAFKMFAKPGDELSIFYEQNILRSEGMCSMCESWSLILDSFLFGIFFFGGAKKKDIPKWFSLEKANRNNFV